MRIFDRLLQFVPQDALVEDLVVGIHWILSKTQYGAGLAATALNWNQSQFAGQSVPEAGSLLARRVHELAYLYDHESWVARALSLSLLSASLPRIDESKELSMRAQDYVLNARLKKADLRVAMIGHFYFAQDLRNEGVNLTVFELEHRCAEGDLPSSRIPDLLPLADIVFMTASTLISHSCEEILKFCHERATCLLVGPSCPIHPCLSEFGITAVCGSKLTDYESARQVIMQGGGHKQIQGKVKSMYFLS